MKKTALIAVALLCAGMATFASAQAPSYGPPVTLEQAKRAIAAAEAEARRNNWPMAIAVMDTAGQLVAFQKMDDTQTASIDISQDKGRSAAIYRRPTKVMEDALAAGGAGVRFLNLRNASVVEGGVPLVMNGKVVGAIGVSGGTSPQDGVVAKAGAEALK